MKTVIVSMFINYLHLPAALEEVFLFYKTLENYLFWWKLKKKKIKQTKKNLFKKYQMNIHC